MVVKTSYESGCQHIECPRGQRPGKPGTRSASRRSARAASSLPCQAPRKTPARAKNDHFSASMLPSAGRCRWTARRRWAVAEVAQRVGRVKDVKQLDGTDQKSSGLAVGHVVFVELGSASVWPMRRQKLFAVRTKATLRGLSVIFVRSCVPGLSKVLRLPVIVGSLQ